MSVTLQCLHFRGMTLYVRLRHQIVESYIRWYQLIVPKLIYSNEIMYKFTTPIIISKSCDYINSIFIRKEMFFFYVTPTFNINVINSSYCPPYLYFIKTLITSAEKVQ